jgi:predicted transcriptional regulator
MRFLFEFDDGMMVEFTGSIVIKKGNEINVYIKEGFVPLKIKEDLEVMSRIGSDVRKLVQVVTDAVGTNIYIKDESMGEGKGVYHE